MSRVLLIDADSTIPNIALMKLSAYHKGIGDTVDIKALRLSYYPRRKKHEYVVPTDYDIAYCSVIYKGNAQYVVGDWVIFGGTGFDLSVSLPAHVEECEPDYSIYPDNDTSYGFITRGCIRNCRFCVVPTKEGRIRKVAEPLDIVKHSKAVYLDNNILAYDKHVDVLETLRDSRVRCWFMQGFDIRLVDETNSKLLRDLNHKWEYVFAFDSLDVEDAVLRGIKLLDWRYQWQLKFYVYVNNDTPLVDIVHRVMLLKKMKCLPYVMRDADCYGTERSPLLADIASYCNQPWMFKYHTFRAFMEIRHNNKNRIHEYSELWNNAVKEGAGNEKTL